MVLSSNIHLFAIVLFIILTPMISFMPLSLLMFLNTQPIKFIHILITLLLYFYLSPQISVLYLLLLVICYLEIQRKMALKQTSTNQYRQNSFPMNDAPLSDNSLYSDHLSSVSVEPFNDQNKPSYYSIDEHLNMAQSNLLESNKYENTEIQTFDNQIGPQGLNCYPSGYNFTSIDPIYRASQLL